MVPFFHG